MRILLDTDVVSLLAPERSPVSSVFRNWVEENTDRLFLSVVTIAEVERGIRKLKRAGQQRKARAIESWFKAIVELHGDRVMPFDVEAAWIAGRLDDEATAKGFNILLAGVAIAATAARHDMAVATRNARRFRPLGAKLIELPL